MSNAITITIPPQHYNNKLPMDKGDIIRLKSKKRWVGKVVHAQNYDYCFQAQLKMIYRPSPKSSLRQQSLFSKNKKELYLK